jgi:hypothetical protein
MYYFYKNDGTITEREFEYNAEVLDGLLFPLKEDDKILILEHRATDKFDYSVRIIKKCNPKEAINFLNTTKIEVPNFYKAVFEDMLDEYLKTSEKFNFISGEPTNKPISVSPKIIPPKKTELPDTVDQESNQIEYQDFKLRRTKEAPSYVYKPPNQL